MKWLTRTVREILERGCSYIIEGPNGKKYRRNQAHSKPLCHDGSSFQDPPKAQKKNPTKSDNLDSFQDPRPRQKKSVTFQNNPLIFESIPNQDTANKMSNPTSHSSYRVQHFSPHSPSSPPAQLSSREKLVSPNAEDHTAPKHRTIIRPQDVNTQLTSGLAALIQETSPLAPYKIQDSAKKEGKTDSQQHALNVFIEIDFFQDPKLTQMAKCHKLTHFKTFILCIILDSFQDPYILHLNWTHFRIPGSELSQT